MKVKLQKKENNISRLSASSKVLEKELLSSLVSNRLVDVAEINEKITAEDFAFYPKHFEAWVESKVQDEHLGVVFAKYDIKISDILGSPSTRPLFKIIDDLKRTHRALVLCEYLVSSSKEVDENKVNEEIEKIYQNVFKMTDESKEEDTQVIVLSEEYEKNQKEIIEKKTKYIGIPTEFEKIDGVIDGIRKGHFWIIGGYTNVGKSSFSLNILLNVLRQGKRVVFYSLEMSSTDIISRLLGLMTQQSGVDILKGKGDGSEKKAMEELKSFDLNIVNNKRELDSITFSMIKFNMKKPVDVFFVDYIQQIIDTKSKSEYEMTTRVASEFQALAIKIKCPIIAVSQISNESARTPKSIVIGMKGSGALAAAADFIIEIVTKEDTPDIHKEKAMKGEPISVRLIVKKNRHGAVGYVDLEFNGKTGRFFSLMQDFLQ